MSPSVAQLSAPEYLGSFQYRFVKRGLDIAGALLGLIVTSPLQLLIALAVKATSRGPVFYRWLVIGEKGLPFTGYKFRTMVVNADALKAQLNAHNERRGPTFKMRNDPRITPIGRILRRYSLDELPQLYSILKGDMSFVGPRPCLRYEWEQYTEYQRNRARVKPGGISLWHVRGQPRAFEDWVELDLEYIRTWSLRLDAWILLRSFGYVIAGRNY